MLDGMNASSLAPDLKDRVLEARRLTVTFGGEPAVREVSLVIPRGQIVALIGPTGAGKSSLVRAFNRMNELQADCEVSGQVLFNGEDVYAPGVDPVEVRRRIGMVFAQPNPFPGSIFDNVSFGLRLRGLRLDAQQPVVETALRRVGLWNEVQGNLRSSALSLSWEQQQRLCIARAVAVGPEVLLMDEPTSSLDPVGTQRVEQLIRDLKRDLTVILVTESLRQAARVSDVTGFLYHGELVEFDATDTVFTNPREERTEAYITGRLA